MQLLCCLGKLAKIIGERLRQPIKSPCNLQGHLELVPAYLVLLLPVEVGCQGFSKNRLNRSCRSRSSFCTATEDCTTLRHTLIHYITLHDYVGLHLAWHCIPLQHSTLHCSTLHYTTLRCTTLQLLCIALRCVALCLYACYVLLHSIELHYVAMPDSTQYITLHEFAAFACMSACKCTSVQTWR